MSDRAAALEKCCKVIRLAAEAPSDGERQAATARAARLVERHGFTEAELLAERERVELAEQPRIVQARRAARGAPDGFWTVDEFLDDDPPPRHAQPAGPGMDYETFLRATQTGFATTPSPLNGFGPEQITVLPDGTVVRVRGA